jgi:hypothetical protein
MRLLHLYSYERRFALDGRHAVLFITDFGGILFSFFGVSRRPGRGALIALCGSANTSLTLLLRACVMMDGPVRNVAPFRSGLAPPLCCIRQCLADRGASG